MPKCLGAELSGHFGTSTEVSSGHLGTGAEVSWYRSVLGPKCPVTIAIVIRWVVLYVHAT